MGIISMRLVFLMATTLMSAFAQDQPAHNRTYESIEKERFVYGKPGDRDYGKPRTAKDIIRLEKMWQLDKDVQQFRGFIQGFHRGMYKDFDWVLPERCISKDTVLMMYYLEVISKGFYPLIFLALVYAVYFNVDNQCYIEQYLYDLSQFCYDHNCTPRKLLENEMGKVF